MPTDATVNILSPVRVAISSTLETSQAEPCQSGDFDGLEPTLPVPATLPIRSLDTLKNVAGTTVPQVPGYEIEREIGRGGMGMVLAARDLKLGREVAVKVLLPGKRSGYESRRFVQESRITARLPHPGIPSVYELGTLSDGTPFLAMKLVCGRTLSAELERIDRITDLPRLLHIFEQVVQAVGFAHSQNVIHRDLKPSNVMVGAFGEVQVMDWGLAKETTDPATGKSIGDPADEKVFATNRGANDPLQTELGMTLGTPAYMAPEQARGEPLGPPADVFALGGILCVILTGQPPFVADTVIETIRLAASGDVTPAFARLDSCAASPELVSLCKQLLCPLAADRPYDGKAVAEALGAYREGVEQRLRDAEIKRVASETRAFEQRKKRQLQMALTASIIVLFGLIGLGAWWQDRQSINLKLDEERRQKAEQYRLARNASALDDLLSQCEDRLRQGDAERAKELLGQAEQRFAEIGLDEAGGQLALVRAGLAELQELNRINELDWSIIEGEQTKKEGLIAAWTKVFRRHGFTEGMPLTNETADRIRGSIIREHLLGTLEKWFWTQPSPDLLVLLDATDPDGYRNDVRTAKLNGNSARIAELAGAPVTLGQPTRFALMLARDPSVLPIRRDQILQNFQHLQPHNFHVLMDLATLRPNERPERTAERVGWYRAALAVQPRSVAAWNNLGNALHSLGQFPQAINCFREAIRIDSNFVAAYSNLGIALRSSKDLAGAIAVYKEAVRRNTGYAPGYNNLGISLQDMGDLSGAIAAYKEAVRLKPDFSLAYSNLASVLCATGDTRGAVAACKEAIRLEPLDALAHSHLGNALRDAGDLEGAIAAYKEAIRLSPNYAPVHSNLGNALRDRGDLSSAIAAYREAVRLAPNFAPAHSYLGNSLREAGDLPAATASCKEAIRLDPKQAHAHHNLGLALKAAGNLSGAIASYREAVRLDPNFARAYNSLGLALKHSGNLPDAIAAFREAVRTDPKYIPAYNNLGISLKASGNLDGAIAAYKEAIRLSPKDVTANYNLGLALTAKDDAPGAIAAYRQAIRLNPKLLLGHSNLAVLLHGSGDLAGAIEEYRTVIQLNPQHAGAHAALGLALLELGDAAEGQKAFAEAVRLDPKQFGPQFRERFPSAIAPSK